MNSKAILLATTVFSIALSASAVADSYYFRSKGNPTASAPGNPNPGGTPPDESATAAIGFLADKYRAGATISGTLGTSLANPAWSFAQSPAEPVLNLAATMGGIAGTAPTVQNPTAFAIAATASEGNKSAEAGPVSVTVHPLLTASGGPSGQISLNVQNAFPAQPNYVLKGLVGAATYALMQSSAPLANLGTLCPGLSFSATNGKVSGTPTAACSASNLKVNVRDDFDNATAAGQAFSINVTPSVVPSVTTLTASYTPYVIPEYNTITFECWGPGGAGATVKDGSHYFTSAYNMGDGYGITSASIGALTLCTANPGKTANSTLGGAGGTAVVLAGATSVAGQAGSNGTGSSSGKGGDAGQTVGTGGVARTATAAGDPGKTPGGGGGGGKYGSLNAGGGGGGGYMKRTFNRNDPGAPVPGASPTKVISGGGFNTLSGAYANGGVGADGQIKVTVN